MNNQEFSHNYGKLSIQMPPNTMATTRVYIQIVDIGAFGNPGHYFSKYAATPDKAKARVFEGEEAVKCLIDISNREASILKYRLVHVEEPAIAPEAYGLACTKCKEYYPDAVVAVGFKCYGCRNGY